MLCSAALASSTASARPTSESPEGESCSRRLGSAATLASGKMSGPAASSSWASVSAASTWLGLRIGFRVGFRVGFRARVRVES
jgi:hypothetical protein